VGVGEGRVGQGKGALGHNALLLVQNLWRERIRGVCRLGGDVLVVLVNADHFAATRRHHLGKAIKTFTITTTARARTGDARNNKLLSVFFSRSSERRSVDLLITSMYFYALINRSTQRTRLSVQMNTQSSRCFHISTARQKPDADLVHCTERSRFGKYRYRTVQRPTRHIIGISGTILYTVFQKNQAPWCLIITLANVDRFSKFFHQMIRKKILYVYIRKISTSPAICCYTILWNSKIKNCYQIFTLNVAFNMFKI